MEELQDDLDIPGFDEEILKQMVSEAEEITEKLSEYGTLNEDEIQSISEVAKKREQQLRMIEESQGSDQTSEPSVTMEQQNQAVDNEGSTEISKFVICPKCGGKIWL